MNTPLLTEYEQAILRHIANSPYGTDQVGKYITVNQLKTACSDIDDFDKYVSNLIENKYIRLIEWGSVGGAHFEAYQCTILGENVLTTHVSSTSYNVGGNAIIAHNSQNVRQTMNINELEPDIREKVEELQTAIDQKDPSAIKKAFGYIADKSVDVAIAIVTGVLLR